MAKIIFASIGSIAFIIALTWVIRGSNLAQDKVLAPKEETVRREVFEETKSYNDGMVNELRTMQTQYILAKPEVKDALASVMLHRVSGIDESKLPSDLVLFIHQLRSAR